MPPGIIDEPIYVTLAADPGADLNRIMDILRHVDPQDGADFVRLIGACPATLGASYNQAMTPMIANITTAMIW